MGMPDLAPVFAELDGQSMSAPQNGADFSLLMSRPEGLLTTFDGRQPFPSDELTGLPLPIKYLAENQQENDEDHHAWNGAARIKSSYLDLFSVNAVLIAGALRASRIYRTPRRFHHEESPDGVHRFLYGNRLPRDLGQLAQVISLGAGDVVPRQGVNPLELGPNGELLQSRDHLAYAVSPLGDTEHAFLASPKRTFVENAYSHPIRRARSRNKLGKFYIHYAVEEMSKDSHQSTKIADYLSVQNGARKSLEDTLYDRTLETLDDLLEPIVDTYNQANEEGMVTVWSREPRAVAREFIPRDIFQHLFLDVIGFQEAA
ncbi:MAG TPA: hypothetical protein VLF88_02900 [Candidatus Babeliales bacterium]|nr:hypothetical protein [Candidatus Babeliales bacterium]